jgi:multiple sugar transport system permease protein
LIVALPFQLIVGYFIAKVFYQIRDIRGAGLIRTLYLIPVMLPEIVVGLLFGYMLNPRIGIVNFLLGEVGIAGPDWFGDSNIAIFSIILLIVWQWTPLAAIILYGGLLGLPGDVREAAAIDGAGRIRQIISIEIPLLRKVIGLVILLVGIQLVGTFAAVYITTQGGPGSSTTVLSYEIYRQAFVFFNTGYGSALSIVTLIVVIALSQVLVRFVFKEEK